LLKQKEKEALRDFFRQQRWLAVPINQTLLTTCMESAEYLQSIAKKLKVQINGIEIDEIIQVTSVHGSYLIDARNKYGKHNKELEHMSKKLTEALYTALDPIPENHED
jgi:hypothetical protein